MSFFRKHVRGLLKQTFNKNGSTESDSAHSDDFEEDQQQDNSNSSDSTLIYERIMNGRNGRKMVLPEIYSGKTGLDLPVIFLDKFDRALRASYTGPDGGLTHVQQVKQKPIAKLANLDDELSLSSCSDEEDEEILLTDCPITAFDSSRLASMKGGSLESLGFCSDDLIPGSSMDRILWDEFCEDRACGKSCSLYERNPISGIQAGTPIADVFGVLARRNNAILALADGVNWGEGARLAARCAIRGAFDHLNQAIEDGTLRTTTDVFHSLLGAFHSAHALILQEGGALTTLCVALVAPVRNSDSYVLCVCNVGDSLCFVHNEHGVREVTLASHEVEHRNMRDAGGALGPVDGRNPQLHNLTCSMTFVEENDLVFITSDGISDNFDPVVGKFCIIKKTEIEKENDMYEIPELKPVHKTKSNGVPANKKRCLSVLPSVDAAERQELMLLRMADVITNGINNLKEAFGGIEEVEVENKATASSLCHNLVDFAFHLSSAKRKTLEDPELYRSRTHSKTEERLRRKMIRNMIMEMPGKLDHASVVAYKVGFWEHQTRKQKVPHHEVKEASNHAARPAQPPPPPPEQNSTNSQINCLVRINKPITNVNSTKVIVQKKQTAESELVLHLDIPPELRNEDCPIQRTRGKSPYEEIPIEKDDNSPKMRDNQGRRKHGRGSTLRHTLGVDVSWLKKLVINKHFSSSGRETDRTQPSGSQHFENVELDTPTEPTTHKLAPLRKTTLHPTNSTPPRNAFTIAFRKAYPPPSLASTPPKAKELPIFH
ncbi:unnamed protein product [Bursaphelenchus okinawaensis]|uniref:PPM-type phosphatase domain-containing protein n=1 Tax=Bursaphelenchus okinawaensis TaxID=465554 RepID=A0A811K8K4_9BILA|nr:unnamed protein product [Bursaphelenchus okinawaensis]CAG9095736.1 unnamed protein product [Bursaphelenchus okinawaensis]